MGSSHEWICLFLSSTPTPLLSKASMGVRTRHWVRVSSWLPAHIIAKSKITLDHLLVLLLCHLPILRIQNIIIMVIV
jgi:hypothetical protein